MLHNDQVPVASMAQVLSAVSQLAQFDSYCLLMVLLIVKLGLLMKLKVGCTYAEKLNYFTVLEVLRKVTNSNLNDFLVKC